MWLITPDGFYSIVEDSRDKRRLLVRARVRTDLARLGIQKHRIAQTPSADYPYRASLTRPHVKRLLNRSLRAIRYPNFKDEVALRQGKQRAAIYHNVWDDLRALEIIKEKK